ncbi:hypothetical protein [Streptococcus cristatus]|uniref:Uncharacterized protein n=1 Tax=Streptococcus cristatus TaxID=45634 RepID=A0A3R9M496_STRCR|nr:hypothetical protein [Streptococcus cristatus]RSJ91147.1 hypothetical protein D8792_03890 [Streptococcus cristatus]
MKFSKVFNIILSLIALVLVLFFRQVIVNSVVSTNLEVSQRNLYVLTIIFWLEILSLLVIYDLVIIELYSGVSYYLSKLGQWAVRTKKVSIALYTIRLNYYLLRLSRLLRVGWVTYGGGEKSSVWIGLSKLSLTQLSLNIFRLIISTPMFLAFLFACFSLKILKGDVAYYLHKLQEFLRGILQIKVNIGDIFSRLPALVALMTILPIVFFFYFYSQKRDVRKIIDKENSQYFEEVVLLYEKLLIWIDNHIYELSENFNYVIKCQDSIVEIFLKKEVPNYISLAGKQYNIPREIETFRFVEITDLTEFREIMSKLSSDRLKKYTRIFSVKRFDVWYLYFFDFPLLNEEERLERCFYTKKGISYKLDNRHTFPYDFTQDQIEKRRKEEHFLLSWSIYDDLKLLYRFKRVSDSLKKYLYSSRTERLILKALNKDK